MPRKTFVNGQVLTDSDLNNFLMNQSVMTFASSAARSSAIPSPNEGMVTWLEDSNTLDIWTGSSWTVVNDNTASVPLNTVTAAGDLIVANGSASVTRLGIGGTNAIPYSTGSALTYLSAGTANQVLSIGTASNLTWRTISTGGGIANKQTFTSSGTWVVPTGVAYVTLIGTGGGCGGASGGSWKNSASQTTTGGQGGLGGQLVSFFNIPVTAGGTATITIGAGGAGGTAIAVTSTNSFDTGNSGSSGASTTFAFGGLTYTLEGQGQASAFNSGRTASTSPFAATTTLPRYLFAHSARPNPAVDQQTTNQQGNAGSGGMTAEQDGLGMTGFVGSNGTGGTGGSSGGNATSGGLYGGGGNGGGLRSATVASGGIGSFGGGGGGGNGFAASANATGGNGGNGAANTAGGGGGGGSAYTNTGGTVTGGNGGNGGSGFLNIFW